MRLKEGNRGTKQKGDRRTGFSERKGKEGMKKCREEKIWD